MSRHALQQASRRIVAATMISATLLGISTAHATVNTLPSLSQLMSDVSASVLLTKAPNPSTTTPPVASMTDADTTLVPSINFCLATSGATRAVPTDAATKCAYGDKSATRTILLTGDSQAAMWLPAVDAMGARTGWKIIFLAMRECGPWGSPNPPTFLLYRNVTVAECTNRNRAVAKWAVANRPAVVLLAGRAYPAGYNIDLTPKLAVVLAEMTAEAKAFAESGSNLIVLGPIPRYSMQSTPYRPVDCLDGATAMKNCQLPVAKLLPAVEISAETTEVRAHLFHYAKLFPLMCTSLQCTTVIKDGSSYHLVFYDGAHINRFFAVWASQAFQEIVSKLLPA